MRSHECTHTQTYRYWSNRLLTGLPQFILFPFQLFLKTREAGKEEEVEEERWERGDKEEVDKKEKKERRDRRGGRGKKGRDQSTEK